MQQPQHDLRPFQVSAASPRRLVSLGLVALLHIIVIYALATGLAARIVAKLPTELNTKVVEQKPQEQEKPPPPPPPDMTKPPPPFVPPPDIVINQQTSNSNAITNVQSSRHAPARPQIMPPTTSGRSHDCQAGYPPVSKRLGEEGTVEVSFVVTAEGNVTNASLVRSSGYSRLDNAAVECVSGWHYHPATQLGQPVAVTLHANVKYKLTGGY